jgi:threonine synthase
MARKKLKCINCDRTYPVNAFIPICPECNSRLTVAYDYEAIKEQLSKSQIESRGLGVWKYFELLPLLFPLEKAEHSYKGVTDLQECWG